ncbi:MAG: AMP-binding protein [Spirochaetia bacterium]
MADKWRLVYNPEGDAADMIAYPSALVEGRIAGKYMLSSESLPNTLIIQGFKRAGIIAGADVNIDKEAAKKQGLDVAKSARGGRGAAKAVGSMSFSDLMAKGSRKFKPKDVEPDKPAVLLYTSGTTGKPKGVILSHRNFITQAVEISDNYFKMDHKDTVIGVLPLFHVYGLANGLIPSMYFGCRLSLVPQYSPHHLLSNIEAVKATVLIAVPSMYMHLIQLARMRKSKIPKTMRISVSGGAPMPLKTLQEFEEVFETQISEGYGLTETTSAVCLNQSGKAYKEGSIGPPAPAIEMKVVDDDGNDLPDGDVGEIIIKGKVVTQGYWNLADETAETIIEGWLHTGDLGYKDVEGFFFITDRKKDLIIRGGFNISPREVEELIYTHPKVQDVAVIGVPDKREREVVKAFVVTKEGETLNERDVLDFCVQNLAPYKVPKAVEFRDSLPKNATGKTLRKELRAGFIDDRLINKEDTKEAAE